MGIYGWSYGGGLTAYAITQTNQFRAASIGEASPNNLVKELFEVWGLPAGLNLLERSYGQRYPYDSSERALTERDDYLSQAGRIRTPALLEFGLYSSEQETGAPLYGALQHFGVPSELVIYPRTAHWLAEPVLMLDSYRRNIAWWDYWLKDHAYSAGDRQSQYERWKDAQRAAGNARWPDSIGAHASP
jgi:dipeptidyl aminopeptidase/acylaminoacyl peptidase